VLIVQARVALARGQVDAAVALATEGIAILDDLGAIDDGEVLMRSTFAEVLHAAGRREEADAALRLGYELLAELLARIHSPELRRSCLTNVPEHARTAELARAWLGLPAPVGT